MTNQEIIDYVMNSPNNTNPALLNQMLKELNNFSMIIIHRLYGVTTSIEINGEKSPEFLYEPAEDLAFLRDQEWYFKIKKALLGPCSIFYQDNEEEVDSGFSRRSFVEAIQFSANEGDIWLHVDTIVRLN